MVRLCLTGNCQSWHRRFRLKRHRGLSSSEVAVAGIELLALCPSRFHHTYCTVYLHVSENPDGRRVSQREGLSPKNSRVQPCIIGATLAGICRRQFRSMARGEVGPLTAPRPADREWGSANSVNSLQELAPFPANSTLYSPRGVRKHIHETGFSTLLSRRRFSIPRHRTTNGPI